MPVAITIRNVPDEVRDTLAARAAANGQSLQEYLRAQLVQSAASITVDDVIDRVRPVTATAVLTTDQILDSVHADRR